MGSSAFGREYSFRSGTALGTAERVLPHVTATPYVADSQINLAELGFASISGLVIPTSIGPFSYFDARLNVTQSLFDSKLINNTRASTQSLKSAEYTFKDARDLVVLAVGYVYLQAIADEARIQTAQAQVETAKALFDQATNQVHPGTSPEIDGLRAKVELQTRQQQLIQAKNNFAIQKLTVARVMGLAPGQEFDLTDKTPYRPFDGVSIDDALKRAYAARSDYLAAMTDVRAAEFSRKAAVAGYYPSLSFNADYGTAGSHLHGNGSFRRARNADDSHFPGQHRARGHFASRCQAPAGSRAPGQSASANRRRHSHGVAESAVVGGRGKRGPQQHRFGGRDPGSVARSLQRGCDRHRGSGAVPGGSRKRP